MVTHVFENSSLWLLVCGNHLKVWQEDSPHRLQLRFSQVLTSLVVYFCDSIFVFLFWLAEFHARPSVYFLLSAASNRLASQSLLFSAVAVLHHTELTSITRLRLKRTTSKSKLTPVLVELRAYVDVFLKVSIGLLLRTLFQIEKHTREILQLMVI